MKRLTKEEWFAQRPHAWRFVVEMPIDIDLVVDPVNKTFSYTWGLTPNPQTKTEETKK